LSAGRVSQCGDAPISLQYVHHHGRTHDGAPGLVGSRAMTDRRRFSHVEPGTIPGVGPGGINRGIFRARTGVRSGEKSCEPAWFLETGSTRTAAFSIRS